MLLFLPTIFSASDVALVLAAGPTLPFLGEIVALFVLAGLIAYLFHRIGLVPIAGFLLTGALIGPGAIGIVEDVELVEMLAEIGVILLLFEIGIEFSLSKLARLKRAIIIGGGLQVGITTALVTGALLAAGLGPGVSVYTGCLVALSSTAIVLGLLTDRAETDAPHGQLSLAVLIFQDLAIIAMVLLVPMLAGEGGTPLDVLAALGLAIAVIAVVLVLARTAIPRILGAVARTQRTEIFVLVVAAICLGIAWLVSLAEVSLALGAFLAGLIVSESEYSEQAMSEVLPFRSIFNAIFFVSVGMLLDLSFVFDHLLLVLGVVVGAVVLKTLVTTGSILALGYPVRIAATTGLALAQIGEFSFVLERAGRTVGLSPAGLGPMGEQIFIAAAVVLMLITPGLVGAAPAFGRGVQRITPGARSEGRAPARSEGEAEAKLEDHVVIVGYGPGGRHLSQVLRETGLPFSVVDLNPRSVREAEAEGIPAIYGDATRRTILKEAGIRRAKLLVVVINDRDAALRITDLARYENPTLHIIARTRFLADIDAFEEAGADVVVPEEIETSVRIFTHVLGAYMVPREEIERHARALREHDYELLRGSVHEAHLMVLKGLDEEGLHTRAVHVREGTPIEGKTLEELHLRRDRGLTVLAVRRGDRTITAPSADLRLCAGDRLVLVGSAEQFAREADLFRPTDEAAPASDA